MTVTLKHGIIDSPIYLVYSSLSVSLPLSLFIGSLPLSLSVLSLSLSSLSLRSLSHSLSPTLSLSSLAVGTKGVYHINITRTADCWPHVSYVPTWYVS